MDLKLHQIWGVKVVDSVLGHPFQDKNYCNFIHQSSAKIGGALWILETVHYTSRIIPGSYMGWYRKKMCLLLSETLLCSKSEWPGKRLLNILLEVLVVVGIKKEGVQFVAIVYDLWIPRRRSIMQGDDLHRKFLTLLQKIKSLLRNSFRDLLSPGISRKLHYRTSSAQVQLVL